MLTRFTYRSIKILIALMFTTIFIIFLFANKSVTLLYGILVVVLFAILCWACSKLSSKAIYIVFSVLLIAFGIALYNSAILMRVYPSWDFGRVYNGVADLIKNGTIATTSQYYLESINNFFPTVWLTMLVRFCSFFGPIKLYDTLILINVMSICSSALFLFLAAKIALDVKTAFCASLILFSLAPLYGYSSIVYTDTLSMTFMSLLLLFLATAIKNIDKKTTVIVFYGLLIGLTAFVGYMLKPTVAFLLIAAFIICLFVNNHLFKLIAFSAVSFAIFFSLYTLWLNNNSILNISQINLYKLPAMHYVHMGLVGYGGYNGDLHSIAASLPDAATRTSNAIAQTKLLLSDYRLSGFVSHLYEKLLYTWNDGLYFSTQKLSQQPMSISSIHNIILSDGKYYNAYYTYTQAVQAAILGLLCVGSIKLAITKNDKIPQIISLIYIAIFGVAVFLLIWETRSRYLINCLPLFALCETWVMMDIVRNKQKIINKNFLHDLLNRSKSVVKL